MSQVVIENPIINSPFDEPTHHFKFSDEGITNEVVAGRRTSSYFVPIAKSKKKGSKQLQFDTAQMHRPMLRWAFIMLDNLFRFSVIAGILILLLPGRASAYIDPGVGSILLQGLLGAVAGGVAVGATFWRKIRDFFSRASQSDGTPER